MTPTLQHHFQYRVGSCVLSPVHVTSCSTKLHHSMKRCAPCSTYKNEDRTYLLMYLHVRFSSQLVWDDCLCTSPGWCTHSACISLSQSSRFLVTLIDSTVWRLNSNCSPDVTLELLSARDVVGCLRREVLWWMDFHSFLRGGSL